MLTYLKIKRFQNDAFYLYKREDGSFFISSPTWHTAGCKSEIGLIQLYKTAYHLNLIGTGDSFIGRDAQMYVEQARIVRKLDWIKT